MFAFFNFNKTAPMFAPMSPDNGWLNNGWLSDDHTRRQKRMRNSCDQVGHVSKSKKRKRKSQKAARRKSRV